MNNPYKKNVESISIHQITPAIAEDMLKFNVKNRKLKQNKISVMAAQMAAGKWKWTGACIAFSTEGVLQNGQHRLLAVIQGGATIKNSVAFGCPPEAFAVTDIGHSRNLSDGLGILGYENTAHLAATARSVWRYKNGKYSAGGCAKLTIVDGISVVRQHPGICEAISFCAGRSTSKGPAIAASMYYLFTEVDKNAAKAFMESLWTGANLSINSPVLTLRNELEKYARMKNRRSDYLAALYIYAWNAYRTKTKMVPVSKILSGLDSKTFPRIV